MAHQRKLLGMTTLQIGVLAGLAAAVCILFIVVGWLMMRGGSRQTPAATTVPQMTSTPYVLPTITPTVTLTPVPYEQLIPEGWVQHETALMEIWLPANFKKAEKDPDEELRLIGSNPKTSLYKMTAIVGYQPLGTDTVDTYIDNIMLKADTRVRVVERRKVSLNGTDAVRMVLEARVDNIDLNELAYLIQDGGTVWVVYYVAQINEFYEMLPTFEQSVKTFRVVR